jgi:long-subunit acyl-CoA synthetase (AMP-forming)
VEILGEDFTGIHACALPLAVLLENVAGVYAGLMAGCTIKLTGLQSFGRNYENLHEVLNRATSVILVPEILRILMAQVVTKGVLPDLKFIAVGGSKIDPALIKQARKMGLPVYEGYGLSECASVVSLNTPEHDKLGSVGKLLPHIRTRIVEGEIQIKDPGFLGYIGEEAAHIFPTGDLGQIDDDGFLSVTGRKKNVLITSYGRNVSPEWVEAALLAQLSIAQAVAYGDAQPHLSALIVSSAPDADIQGAINKANATLPDYAQIKYFQIVPPFTIEDGTLTGTGRPRREVILSKYRNIIETEEAA